MARDVVEVRTADGVCPTVVVTPSFGEGPWPGVIFYMDGFGPRPALDQMARRIADEGFVVLVPDLFYRVAPYEPRDPKQVLASGDVRAALAPLISSTDTRRAARDTEALLEYFEGRTDVTSGPVGVTGYCLGGGLALGVAGTFPARVAAAASFHGGGLATDSDLSPHLLVPKITAKIYIGAADRDTSYPAAMAGRLIEAFMAAGVDHCHELYAGLPHGWTIPDLPIHDTAGAERHHERLVELLRGALCS